MNTMSFLKTMVMAILIIAVTLVFVMPYVGTSAAETNPKGNAGGGGGTGGGGGGSGGGGGGSGGGGGPKPSEYLKNLYIWFLGFVGIAALFALVMGGVMYMFAGANLTKTEAAKKWITNAILGIVLAAASVLLLRTINPDLVREFDLEEVINKAAEESKSQK